MGIGGIQMLVDGVDVGYLLEELRLGIRTCIAETGRGDLEVEMSKGAVLLAVGSLKGMPALEQQRRGLQCFDVRGQGIERLARDSQRDVRAQMCQQVRARAAVLA